jgi:hypothetical protein
MGVVREQATAAQRLGFLLALVEACLLAFIAVVHFAYPPFLYPAGLIEGIVAIGLLSSVLLPGGGGVRAGRVLAAQVLAVIGLIVGQISLLFGAMSMARNEIVYGVVLVLAVASVVLVASPMTSIVRRGHRRPHG